ncbi:MAG TPA: glycine betaine ABC transporter substrate-binding protein [Rubrobacter sp.]|nr:glycine betaine ABC transporter substrate-binding protein [Rubrobacter sp.]
MGVSFRLMLGIFVLSIVAVGCGGGGGVGGGGNVGGGEAGQKVNLSGLEISVGSKEFTEQRVLGEIAVQALEAAGATVEDRTGMAGTEAARRALLSGEIDAYWEYTGTAWITHLGHEDPIPDSQKQYRAVAKEDRRKNGIRWLAPAPANNSFAITVRSEAAEVLGVETLSGFAALSELRPEDATLCAADEFLSREDGLPGMEEAYDFELPEENVVETQEGRIYGAVDEGEDCNFGEVFETDGRIEALDLTLLEDDRRFFPIYNPSFSVREDVMAEHPGISEVFAPISEDLDNETLRGLNAAVAVDGEPAEDVARQFLRDSGAL